MEVHVLNDAANEYSKGKFEDIQKGTEGTPIVRVVGFWFQPKQWGMSVISKQILVSKQEQRLFPYVWADHLELPRSVEPPVVMATTTAYGDVFADQPGVDDEPDFKKAKTSPV
jgi:hypothetical protein